MIYNSRKAVESYQYHRHSTIIRNKDIQKKVSYIGTKEVKERIKKSNLVPGLKT